MAGGEAVQPTGHRHQQRPLWVEVAGCGTWGIAPPSLPLFLLTYPLLPFPLSLSLSLSLFFFLFLLLFLFLVFLCFFLLLPIFPLPPLFPFVLHPPFPKLALVFLQSLPLPPPYLITCRLFRCIFRKSCKIYANRETSHSTMTHARDRTVEPKL